MNSGLPSKQFAIHKCPLHAPVLYLFAVSKCGLMTTGHGRACGTQAVGDVIDSVGPRWGWCEADASAQWVYHILLLTWLSTRN